VDGVVLRRPVFIRFAASVRRGCLDLACGCPTALAHALALQVSFASTTTHLHDTTHGCAGSCRALTLSPVRGVGATQPEMADWESTGTASLLEEDSETLTALARIEAARRSPPAAARDHSHSPAMAVTSPTRTRLTSFDSIPPTSPLSRPSPYAHAGDECTPVHVAWSAASVADAEPREEQPRSDGAASPCVVQNRDYRDKLEVRVGAENVVVRLPPRSPAPEVRP
jgi:hypothetical protein